MDIGKVRWFRSRFVASKSIDLKLGHTITVDQVPSVALTSDKA